MTQGQFLSWIFHIWILLDRLSHQAKKARSVQLFTRTQKGNIWIHTCPKGFALCEMQTASSSIWTLVTVSIFYGDNRYTTNASHLPYLPTPPLGQDMNQRSIFKRSLTGFNSEYSFS